MDGSEGFIGRFGFREVGFGVRGGDDGEVAAEGGFDFLVEMVAEGRAELARREEGEARQICLGARRKYMLAAIKFMRSQLR